MGSRALPVECEHGVIIDWGDFGPDPDDGSVGVTPCPDCEPPPRPTLTEDERAEVEWWRTRSLGTGRLLAIIDRLAPPADEGEDHPA